MIFTDLDGTLLDARTYSFEPARPALRRLAAAGIPVIPVTSKTFAEVRPLAEVLGLAGPVVLESGGGIARRAGRSWRLEGLGAGTKVLRKAVPVIELQTGARLLLYSAMRIDEAAAASGLTGVDLSRSMQRRFGEPFLLERGSLRDVQEAAEALGFRVRSGARFHHLCGPTGTGDAVKRVCDEIAASLGERPFVVALGDAPMDAEFLSIADVPIIVPRQDGTPDPLLTAMLPEARIAPAAGPRGWAQAIDEIAQILAAPVGTA